MPDQSWYDPVLEEMEKDGYDLFEQAMILILGGVFGGQAFQVAQEDYSMILSMLLYSIILLATVFTVASIHFIISYSRAQAGEKEGD